MTPFVHEFYVNLRTGAAYERAKKPLSQGNALADKIVVHVQDCGKDVDLSGMGVSALVVRFDGQTVPLTGTVEDGAACITLDKDSYAVPGEARVTVMLSAGEMVQTVLVLLLNVDTSQTSIIVDNGTIGDLTDLLGAIAEMRTATADALEAAAEANAAVDNVKAVLTDAAPSIVADASGAVATITDGAERPAKDIVSTIEAVQSGEGDPSPDNVRPISGWDVVNVKRVGKNLVDVPNYENTIVSTIRTNTSAAFAAVPYEENTQYTISADVESANTSASSGFEATYTDGTRKYYWLFTNGSQTAKYCTTEAGKTVSEIKFTYNTLHEATVRNIQLETGAVATAYEPYRSATLSVDLPETVYGGSLDWMTGVLTVTHALGEVTAFDELYTSVDSSLTCGQANKWPGMRQGAGADGWCEMLTPVASIQGRTTPCVSFGGTSSAAIYAAYPATLVGTTLASLNEYVAQNPLCVAYPLETPYEVQLTPQQLDMLKGSNSLWSDCGDTAVTYVADTKMYIDKVVGVLYDMFFNS